MPWSRILIALALAAGTPPLFQVTPGDAPVAVREVTTEGTLEDLDLSFSFQEPGIYGAGMSAHFSSIEGQPSAGARYAVEASVSGQRLIKSLQFVLVDEDGAPLGPIPMVADHRGYPGEVEFIGMVTVPTQPFSVQMKALLMDGRRVTGTDPHLAFRPVKTPPRTFERQAWMPADLFARLQQSLVDATRMREALVTAHPAGPVTLPKSRVTNVVITPRRSADGSLLGMRLVYDVEFDRDGRYSPQARVFQHYASPGIIQSGLDDFRVVQSSVSPLPHLAHAPDQQATFWPNVGQQTDFLYRAKVRYTLTADLVPGFIVTFGPDRKNCLYGLRFSREGELARMLSVLEPTRYQVLIDGETFTGELAPFESEGTLYQNWLDAGTPPCPTQGGG